MKPLRYHEWNPGIIHGDRTLGAVKATLPAAPPDAIPGVVHLFEGYGSPWALPGAISLERHDCLHIVLGRGLKGEDEGFVIGFTMGASDGQENQMTDLLRRTVTRREVPYETPVVAGLSLTAIAAEVWADLDGWDELRSGARYFADFSERNRALRDLQIAMFERVSQAVYPHPYRFSDTDILAFRLGLGLGERCPTRNLEDYPFELSLGDSVSLLRHRFGISALQIEAANRLENLYACSRESRRLDTSENGADHSRLTDIEAPDSGWTRETP